MPAHDSSDPGSLFSQPVVFSRPVTPRIKRLVALLACLTGLGCGLTLSSDLWLGAWLSGVAPAGAPAWIVPATLFALGLIAVALFATGLREVRRRYGHCVLHGDQAVFGVALSLGKKTGEVTISLNDVDARKEVSGGVILEVRARGAWANALFPLLIPTADEQELARAVALLDRLELEESLEGDADGLRFGRSFPRRLHGLSLIAFGLPLALALPYAAGLAFALTLVGALLMITTLIAAVVLTGLWLWLLAQRYQLVRIGREALLVGQRRLFFGEVQRLSLAPPFLVWEGAEAPAIVWFGPRLAQAADAIDARLEAVRGPELRVERTPAPAARALLARRARAAWALGALYLALVLSLAALHIWPPALYGDVTATDSLGNSAHLIYRVGDKAPVFLLLTSNDTHWASAGSGGASIRVGGLCDQSFGRSGPLSLDLPGGFGSLGGQRFELPPGATCASVGSGGRVKAAPQALPSRLAEALLAKATFGMIFDRDPLPDQFEELDPAPQNEALASFVRGETSTRTFEALDGQGWRFAWGVDEGRTVFVFVGPAALSVQVVLPPFLVDFGGPTGALLHRPEHSRAVLWPDGSLHFAPQPATLPAPEVLRRVSERIRAGERVIDASRELLSELLPPGE